MADEEYCDPEDIFDYGVSRGAVVHPAQTVSSVDVTTNRLTIAAHSFRLDAPLEPVVFPGGELPAELSEGTLVYARPVSGSDSQLELAAAPGGPAINLTTEGENWGLVPNLREVLRGHIRMQSRLLEPFIPAHAMPLEPDLNGRYPDAPRYIVAVLAGEAALAAREQTSAANAAAADRVRKTMEKLLAGLPLRDPKVTTASTNLARGSSPTASTSGVIP